MQSNYINVGSISPDKCCGCAACMDACPSNAITMSSMQDNNRMPYVDAEVCVNCGLCVRLCPRINDDGIQHNNQHKKSYLGYYNNKNISAKSSSGGLFAALAHYIIEQEGIVYGASMSCDNGSISCHHIRITDAKELYLLQGSKYVQSRTDGIFKSVKADLKSGHKVLFSGTSCQVASLKRFIGLNDNLYTVDLVCHGVPKERIFKDYVEYYEAKHHCKIQEVSFRTKGVTYHGKETSHVLTLLGEKSGHQFEDRIVEQKSAYYCLFMGRAGYRESCYHCSYASPDKPADITLGDWHVKAEDARDYQLNPKETYSTIIVHNKKGKQLIDEIRNTLTITEVPLQMVVSRHGNLRGPSILKGRSKQLYVIYQKYGYNVLQTVINLRAIMMDIRWVVNRLSHDIQMIV